MGAGGMGAGGMGPGGVAGGMGGGNLRGGGDALSSGPAIDEWLRVTLAAPPRR
jgi:hypothetical protein